MYHFYDQKKKGIQKKRCLGKPSFHWYSRGSTQTHLLVNYDKFIPHLPPLPYVCNYTIQLTYIFGLINFISSLPYNFIVVDQKAANRNLNIF